MVYLIDDDASVRKAFGRLLRSANLDAETFSSAEEFLSSPKQEENACIIIDIQMPGLTGFDLLERLVKKGIRIPVIAVSAHDDAETPRTRKGTGSREVSSGNLLMIRPSWMPSGGPSEEKVVGER